MIPDSQFSLHNIQKPKHTAGSAVTVALPPHTLAVAFPGSQTETALVNTALTKVMLLGEHLTHLSQYPHLKFLKHCLFLQIMSLSEMSTSEDLNIFCGSAVRCKLYAASHMQGTSTLHRRAVSASPTCPSIRFDTAASPQHAPRPTSFAETLTSTGSATTALVWHIQKSSRSLCVLW